jgi:hypothetical protein
MVVLYPPSFYGTEYPPRPDADLPPRAYGTGPESRRIQAMRLAGYDTENRQRMLPPIARPIPRPPVQIVRPVVVPQAPRAQPNAVRRLLAGATNGLAGLAPVGVLAAIPAGMAAMSLASNTLFGLPVTPEAIFCVAMLELLVYGGYRIHKNERQVSMLQAKTAMQMGQLKEQAACIEQMTANQAAAYEAPPRPNYRSTPDPWPNFGNGEYLPCRVGQSLYARRRTSSDSD